MAVHACIECMPQVTLGLLALWPQGLPVSLHATQVAAGSEACIAVRTGTFERVPDSSRLSAKALRFSAAASSTGNNQGMWPEGEWIIALGTEMCTEKLPWPNRAW